MPQDINIRPTVVLDQQFTYTPEDVANKSTDGTLTANSDTLYPSQKAVKTYADTKQANINNLTLTAVTPEATDKVLIQDVSATNELRTVTAQNVSRLSLPSGTVAERGVVQMTTNPFEFSLVDVMLNYGDILGYQKGFQSALKAQTIGIPIQTANTSTALTDNVAIFSTIYNAREISCNGVMFFCRTQGVFTGDQENSLALYSINSATGDLTRIAITANNQNIWKGTANTFVSTAWTSPVTLLPGTYIVAGVYNSSAQTTAPAIATASALASSAMGNIVFGNANMKLYGTRNVVNALQSSYIATDITAGTIPYWFGLY
jgi:hypothetical protein